MSKLSARLAILTAVVSVPLAFAACEVETHERHYHHPVVYAPPQPTVVYVPPPPPPQPTVVVAPPPPGVVYAPAPPPAQPVIIEEAPPQQILIVHGAPPQPYAERRPPHPRGKGEWFWIPGYWAIRGNAWVWVFGRYEHPPHPGAVWVPHHWDPHGDDFHLTVGFWR